MIHQDIWRWLKQLQAHRPQRHSPRIWRRRRVAALFLLVLLVGFSGFYGYFTAGQRLGDRVITALERVTGGQVVIREATLSILEQVRIKGLEIYLPNGPKINKNLIFSAEDVILQHEPLSLLKRRLVINNIVSYGTLLNILYDPESGRTNLQQLLTIHGVRPQAERPRIVIRQGLIRYQEIGGGPGSRVVQQPVSGNIYPHPKQGDTYGFELHASGEGILPQSSLQGEYQFGTGRLTTHGKFILELINFTDLPEQVARWWEQYNISEVAGEVMTQSHYDPVEGSSLDLTLKKGAFRVPLGNRLLPLAQVNARIHFTPEHIEIQDLSGRFGELCGFYIQGTYRGYAPQADFDVEVHTEGLVVPTGLWNSPPLVSGQEPHQTLKNMEDLLTLLPRETLREIGQFSPTGPMDVAATWSRHNQMDATYHIECIGRDTSVRYLPFPYPLEAVRGRVVFEPNRVEIGPLISHQDAMEVSLEGFWRKEPVDARLDVLVKARRVPLDERLYGALNSWQQRLWEKLSAAGMVNIVYHTTREPQQERKEKLDLSLVDVQLRYADLPLPLTAVKGEVTYTSDYIDVAIQEAIGAEGRLAIIGRIEPLTEGRPVANLDVSFQGLRLNEGFAEVLGGTSGDFWRRLNLRGVFAGQGYFVVPLILASEPNRSFLSGPVDYRLDFTANNGRLKDTFFSYELTQMEMTGVLNPRQLEITNLAGRHGGSQLSLTGWIQHQGRYLLQLQGEPLFFDDDLWGNLQKLGWGTDHPVRLLGPTQMQLNVENDAEGTVAYTAVIEPQGGVLQLKDVDEPFRNVRGRVVIEPNQILIGELLSEDGPARFRVEGQVITEPDHQSVDLHLQASALPMKQQFRQLLPGALRTLLQQTELQGAMEQMDIQLTRQQQGPDQDLWQATGMMVIDQAAFTSPLQVDHMHARLEGQGRYEAAGKTLQFSGRLTDTNLRVSQRPLEAMKADFTYDSGNGQLVVRDLSGRLCQGRLAGQVQAQIADKDIHYELQLLFEAIDLAQLVNTGRDESRQHHRLQGRFNGWFNLSGEVGDIRSRQGRFLFLVKNGVLWELPIMAQILNVLNLALPEQGAFNYASLSGDIVGSQTRFDDIQLKGSALSLSGAGTMQSPGNKLDLNFVVDPPRYLQNLPVITSFVNAVRPSLIQVRISGTFEEPNVDSVALPGIEEALRQWQPSAEDAARIPLPPLH